MQQQTATKWRICEHNTAAPVAEQQYENNANV